MKLRQHFILIVFVILSVVSCSTLTIPQQIHSKGKLLIIGGGSRPTSMVYRIIKESGLDNGGYGIVLPMSSAEPDSAVYYAKGQFTKLGIDNIYGLHFKKDEKLTMPKLDSMKNAKLIYISGGDQNRFMKVVEGTDIENAIHEAYKNGSLIAGTSAGAAVMSKVMITGNELKHPEYNSTFRNIESENIEIKNGLGLISEVVIDQHFIRRSRYNRLLSAVIEHPKLVGIGIDESTAILIDGKKIEVIGEAQVIVIKNPNRSKTLFEDKMGAHNLSLDIYLPGETFKLN